MLKLLLLIPFGLLFFVLYRLYSFLKVTDAPILNGKKHFNIRYKKGKRLDVYQPTRKVFARSPVLVFLHGGGWVMGSKYFVNNARFHGALNELRQQGYAIISPKYTLAKAGRSPFPASLADVHDALAWLEKNADRYRFDLKNVGLLGESAGAHIGLLAANCEPETFDCQHQIKIRYVVDIYGPTALYPLYRQLMPFIDGLKKRAERYPRRLRSRFNVAENIFGFDPRQEPERARVMALRFSPVEKLTAEAPPTLVIHGSYDQLVPLSQSRLLVEKMETLNVPHEYHVLPGVGHAFRGASREQRLQVQEWITDFVLRQYAETVPTDLQKLVS